MGCSTSNIVFQPPSQNLNSPPPQLYLRTSHNNQIAARYIDRGFDLVVLLSHGNAQNLFRVQLWAEQVFNFSIKANIMLYEYTGYGNSYERPSQKFVYSDCQAALQYLTQTKRVSLNKIILYGKSLGSGPSCYLAQKYPQLGGLILQTPLMSICRVPLELRFTFPFDMFPNIDRMKKIRLPVLMMHGTRDQIVPLKHTEELMKACASEWKQSYFVEGAGHNDIECVGGRKLFEVIQRFLDVVEGSIMKN